LLTLLIACRIEELKEMHRLQAEKAMVSRYFSMACRVSE